MKYNINFNEFLLDLLLEKEGQSRPESVELPFVLSDRLKNILENIPNNTICDNLLNADKRGTDKKVTMVDIDEKEYDKFTFTNSNKFWNHQKEKNFDLIKYKIAMDSSDFRKPNSIHSGDWTILRTSIKIGRFINKLYPDTFHNTRVEEFVNEIKSRRKILDSDGGRIKVVEGEDIKKYYLSNKYDSKSFNGSTLGSSCMRHDSCQDYIDFYAKNTGVKLVILMSNKEVDKIIGRALLWDISELNGEPVDRKFMDRVYYIEESDVGLFHDYAKENNWLYKVYQDMNSHCSIYDPEKDQSGYHILKTTETFKTTNEYPYMDTMKWFFVNDGFLTNDEDMKDDSDFDGDIYFLESTGGGYDNAGGIYVEYYGRSYPEDELVYCDYGDEWRLPEDAYHIDSVGEYATNDYVDYNMFWYDDELFFNEDGIYSDYLEKDIPDKYAIEVYRDSDYESLDDLIDNEDVAIYDKNEWDIEKRLIKYFDPITNEIYLFDKDYCGDDFIDVKTSDMKESETIKMNKKWDKDRYFKWKGEYYADVLNLKDKLTGQKRIWKDENDL